MNAHHRDSDEYQRALGRILADRGTWRHWFNQLRAALDLPALTTEALSNEEGAGTLETLRLVVRESEKLPDVVARAKWLEEQRRSDAVQMSEDMVELTRMRRRINDLEAQVLNLGGEP